MTPDELKQRYEETKTLINEGEPMVALEKLGALARDTKTSGLLPRPQESFVNAFNSLEDAIQKHQVLTSLDRGRVQGLFETYEKLYHVIQNPPQPQNPPTLKAYLSAPLLSLLFAALILLWAFLVR